MPASSIALAPCRLLRTASSGGDRWRTCLLPRSPVHPSRSGHRRLHLCAVLLHRQCCRRRVNPYSHYLLSELATKLNLAPDRLLCHLSMRPTAADKNLDFEVTTKFKIPLHRPPPPFNPYCHQRSRHLNPYDLTFPTDSIQSTQTEESFRQPQSFKGDVRGPITSNSGRSSPDRPKNASRNNSVTENASSNVKRPPDELICALQNSELRTFPSTEISAKCVASATPHRRVVGQVIRPQKYPPKIIDQQECPTPLSIYLFRKIYSAT